MADDKETRDGEETADEAEPGRIFLVVVDDSEEMRVALRFACRRARHTDGRVALLYVIEPTEFQHFMGVGDLMREEARGRAELYMQRISGQVKEISGRMPVVFIREGDRRDELLALIQEEPMISILVLAASAQGNTPGPLIAALTSKFAARLSVPLTVVPGNLSDAAIDAVS
ncbi:MAG: universal stress protein [Pseudomonadota bacterium]